MKKYLVVQRSMSTNSSTGTPPSPADMDRMYQQFTEWKNKHAANIIDMGGKLARDGKVVTTNGVKDGPLPEAKEIIGGYMIITAASLDEAAQIGSECPGVISPSSGIEVREISTS
jgi:hypothetical protein